MSLDAATTAMLEAAERNSQAPAFYDLDPAEARELTNARGTAVAPGPELAHTSELAIPVSSGGRICLRIHTPRHLSGAVVLYLHGGGWVLGNLDSHDSLARHLAEKADAVVVQAEYRKAPEHQFPIPVEDSWEAYRWVVEHARQLAGESARIFIAGDSAGGNLAAVVAHRALDRGVGDVAGQILIYPVVDHNLERSSYHEAINQTLLPRRAMEYFWNHYLPDSTRRSNPEASPLLRENLDGLPPALIITAEHDVLREEGEAYAERLAAAGIDVQQHRWPGQMHGFIQMVGVLPASLDVASLIAHYISAHN